MEKTPTPSKILRDLGNDLILRRSTPSDADQLEAFNSRIHGGDEPDPSIGVWTRDLLSGKHPTFRPDDFLVVENTRSGKIISSSNLISQTWSYAGIAFKVGRPELIGTEADYRRRGLVRMQMEILHAWSAERGELVQAITGIPEYYRQFGYEMTIRLDSGRYVNYTQNKPLPEGEQELYSLRPAKVEEIPVIRECYEDVEKRNVVTCQRSSEYWEYELTGKSLSSVDRTAVFMIEDSSGRIVGTLGVRGEMWAGDGVVVSFYGLCPGNSYLMITPAVLRFLWKEGQKRMPEGKTCSRIVLPFGTHHPIYEVLDPRRVSLINHYAYYMRVPDVPGFLRLITPVLEQRLAESCCAGHSGELKVSLYRDGFTMQLENGKIAGISRYYPVDWLDGDAFFPGQTFLHLLFQSRGLTELNDFYDDCRFNNTGYALLNAMFPCSPSAVWAIG